MNLVTVSHKGTYESILSKKQNMLLPAHFPIPNKWYIKWMEDRRKVVWLKRGKARIWDIFLTGMYGKHAEAWVEFELDKSKLTRPNGIIKFFFLHQVVALEDVKIPESARFYYKNKIWE